METNTKGKARNCEALIDRTAGIPGRLTPAKAEGIQEAGSGLAGGERQGGLSRRGGNGEKDANLRSDGTAFEDATRTAEINEDRVSRRGEKRSTKSTRK